MLHQATALSLLSKRASTFAIDTKNAISNNKPVDAIVASNNLKNLLPNMVKTYSGLTPCLDSHFVFKLDANKFAQEIEKLGFLAIAGMMSLA